MRPWSAPPEPLPAARVPRFHGDCDVAAMVYGRGSAPDSLLADFMFHLLGQGFDVLGVIQARGTSEAGTSPEPVLQTIPDDLFAQGRMPTDTAIGQARQRACGTALPGIGASLTEGLKRRPDLLVLNRYGSQEMAGAGLLGALAEAIDRDIPVLIAVPEALFPRWLTLAHGLAVRVAPDRASLLAWWRSLGKAETGATGTTFCDRFK